MEFFFGMLGLFYLIVLFCIIATVIVAYASGYEWKGCFQPVDAAIGFVCLVMWPFFAGGVVWIFG